METCKLNCKPDRDDGHSVKPLCGICACPSLSGNDIVYSYYYKEKKKFKSNFRTGDHKQKNCKPIFLLKSLQCDVFKILICIGGICYINGGQLPRFSHTPTFLLLKLIDDILGDIYEVY